MIAIFQHMNIVKTSAKVITPSPLALNRQSNNAGNQQEHEYQAGAGHEQPRPHYSLEYRKHYLL